MTRSLLAVAVLLLTAGAGADPQYWIAIGSYSNLAYAEEARARADAILAEPFAIVSVDVAGSRFNRVLAGPFLTRELASDLLRQAREAGFDGAWLLAEDAGYDLSTDVGGADPYVGPGSFDRLLDDLPAPDALPPPRPAAPQEQRKPPVVVDEPPPGYQLNRLHREARYQPPGGLPGPQSLAGLMRPAFSVANQRSALAAGIVESPDAPAAPGVTGVMGGRGAVLALQRFDQDAADIRVDGHIDEPVWREVAPLEQMRVVEPDLLTEPPYRTIVRLFYTERGLYVAFENEQPAETIVRRLSQRDDGRLTRDSVSFTLDTSGEGRYGYWMNLALGDNQVDGTILPERQYSRDWDGAWYGATTVTDEGWSAEFFVPWSQMAMPDEASVRRIGIYASRQVAYLNQRWGWPALPRTQPRFMSLLQPLALEGVNPKQQWSLFPYTSATSDRLANDVAYKAGFDLFWRPSTNFQMTATANPDFGNVESDDVIVNLTAVETFYPEKRLFFLEGQEIFNTTPRSDSFSNGGDVITLVNTRRIGGSPRAPDVPDDVAFSDQELGQPSELYGAAKVTGQMGALRYGALAAFEEDTRIRATDGRGFDQSGRDFGAARVLYEDSVDGAYRALGYLATVVAHPESDAIVHGIDAHYLTPDGHWKYDGQLMVSDVDDSGTGAGGFLDIQFTPRTGLKYTAKISHFDDQLDINDFGYLRRNDATDVALGAQWVRSGMEKIRDFEVSPFARYERNGDGYMTKAGIGSRFEVTFNDLNRLEGRVAFFPKRYEDLNSFGNGTYRIEERPSVSLGYSTDPSRPLSLFASSEWEEDGVDGQTWEHKAGIVWRPVDRLNLQVETRYTLREGWLLHQEDRNMTAFDSEQWQPKLNLDFFISAKQQFRVALQWVGIKATEDRFYSIPLKPGDLVEIAKPDAQTDDFSISQMNFQARYRWQIAPLSDLFLVYTRNGLEEPVSASFGDLFQNAWQDPIGDQLVVKLRYRLGT
ncbi:MAG: DUF5916 domain-containing protein [Pseudomonadales bacterium]